VLGARVMGLACDVGNTLSTLAWPGYVLLSPATITSTPLLIFFVAKLKRLSSNALCSSTVIEKNEVLNQNSSQGLL